MERSLVLFAIGLIFGGGIGFVVAAGNGVTFDGHDHATGHDVHNVLPASTDYSAGHAAGHNHDTMVSLPAGPGAPALEISLEPDPVSGWNLHIVTDNFTFAPDRAGLAHTPGEGHAHVYVNGEKVARVYGPWFHLPALPEGRSLVEVTLNANDHSALAVDGKALKASVTVTSE